MAHLLRELKYLSEFYSECCWPVEIKSLFMQALQLIKDLALRDYYHSNQQRTNLEIQLKELLRNPLHEKHGKARHYKKVLIKHQTNILYFLHHPKVPPDDKGSEKAIRNIKVKQKYPGNLNQTKALMALLS